jgi:hypothetical protein
MYGVVNKAIEQVIRRDHGEADWNAICGRAGIETDTFISAYEYPDEVTYRLVDAAAGVLGVPVDHVLERLGEYWAGQIAPEYYGPILEGGCCNAMEYLKFLPEIQARLRAIFPQAQPVEYLCDEITDGALLLHYRSTAQGNLTPFIAGLVRGVGRLYGTTLDVQLLEDCARAGGRTTFRVACKPGA